MCEIVLVCLAAPEPQIRDLKVAPEVACAIPVCFVVVVWSSLTVHQPLQCIVWMKVFGMCRKKLNRFGPQGGQRIWGVVQVYVKAVRFVVVLHITEDIIIDVAEKLDFGLDAPVV